MTDAHSGCNGERGSRPPTEDEIERAGLIYAKMGGVFAYAALDRVAA